MSKLCYWCDGIGNTKCKNCKRDFCKFCIKNEHSEDEKNLLCFICGCYERSEGISECGNSCLKDRETQDMLHRYMDLCSNQELAKSFETVLENIDNFNSDNASDIFKLMKANLYSMLHDIEKVESMVNRALDEKLLDDINLVLIPLTKVVVKHHVFKKLTRLELIEEIDNTQISNIEKDMNDFIDLTEDKMDFSRNGSIDDEDDYERMQRSPLRLSHEETLTQKFEVNYDIKEEEEIEKSRPCSPVNVPKCLSRSPSVKSSMKDSDQMKTSPKVIHESNNCQFFENSESGQKKRRSRRVIEMMEVKRSVRLRSESNVSLKQGSNTSKSKTSGDENQLSNEFQTDLTAASTVFKSTVSEPKSLRSGSKKIPSNLTSKDVSLVTVLPKPCKKSSSVSSKDEMSFESLLAHANDSGANSNGNVDLQRFSKVLNRNKNSHLVCPAPTHYEKPFILTDFTKKKVKVGDVDDPLELEDDIMRPPVSNKTWSWERQPQASTTKILIPIRSSSHGETVTPKGTVVNSNGTDLQKILTKQSSSIILQKPLSSLPSPLTVIPSTSSGKLRLMSSVSPVNVSVDSSISTPTLKRSLSPSQNSLDEPKKKRGRPRKYFNNYSFQNDGDNSSFGPVNSGDSFATTDNQMTESQS